MSPVRNTHAKPTNAANGIDIAQNTSIMIVRIIWGLPRESRSGSALLLSAMQRGGRAAEPKLDRDSLPDIEPPRDRLFSIAAGVRRAEIALLPRANRRDSSVPIPGAIPVRRAGPTVRRWCRRLAARHAALHYPG